MAYAYPVWSRTALFPKGNWMMCDLTEVLFDAGTDRFRSAARSGSSVSRWSASRAYGLDDDALDWKARRVWDDESPAASGD